MSGEIQQAPGSRLWIVTELADQLPFISSVTCRTDISLWACTMDHPRNILDKPRVPDNLKANGHPPN